MELTAFNILTKIINNKNKDDHVDYNLIQLWHAMFELAKPILINYNSIFKLPFKENPDIILTMTSCKRLDLFTKTVNSILNTWLDLSRVDQFIVIDDNSSYKDRSYMQDTYPFIKFIMKPIALKGHVESMNMIYDILKEKKPSYWIHVEDDFLFFNPISYITLGINGLKELQHFNVKQIMFNRNYIETFDQINMKGHIPYSNSIYSLHDYKQNGNNCQYWPYFSFRPSIIDVDAILNIGDFTSSMTFFEMEYARKWTNFGYKTAFLNTVTNIHIGKLCNTIGENAYSLNDVPQFNGQVIKRNFNIKVINMDNRPDRLAMITEKLDKENLLFERYSAVNGKKLTMTPDLYKLFRDNDFNFRRGVIGCALSHYNLWKELVESNESYYVIMEDDVSLCNNFSAKLNDILKIRTYDILFLGYHMTKIHKENNTIYRTESEKTIIDPLKLEYYIGGTHCYVITKEGANTLIDYISMYGITNGIDYFMTKKQKILPVYETIPHLAFANWVDTKDSKTDSDIQNDYNSIAINISDKYIFLDGLDQIGHDIHVTEKDTPKCDYENIAESLDGCIAFNTLGYFKNKITELVKSQYFSPSDGIYVDKDYYYNVFKKKE